MSSRRSRRKQARARKKQEAGVAESEEQSSLSEENAGEFETTSRTYKSSLEENSTPVVQQIFDITQLESLGVSSTPY